MQHLSLGAPKRQRSNSPEEISTHGRSVTPIPQAPQVVADIQSFRIQDIPNGRSKQEVCSLLRKHYGIKPDLDLRVSLCQSIDQKHQVGIMTLEAPRNVLSGIAPEDCDKPPYEVRWDRRDRTGISVDRHFYGLTPLNTCHDTPTVE